MNSLLRGVLSRGVADLLRLAIGVVGSVFSDDLSHAGVCVSRKATPSSRQDQLVWKPLIPGVEMAVVSGDPDKKGGLYVIRIRSKAEVKVPPHWHPTDEHVTVLAGSFLDGSWREIRCVHS